jgi:peroxiredoxin
LSEAAAVSREVLRFGLVGLVAGVLVSSLGAVLFLAIVRPTTTDPVQQTGGLEIGTPAPALAGLVQDGRAVSLSDLRGRPVWVEFWSIDCKFCTTEIPDLRQFTKLIGASVSVLTVASTVPTEQVRAFVRDRQIDYPVIADQDARLLNLYRIKLVPFVYMIDGQGRVVRTVAGGRSLDEMKQDFFTCKSSNSRKDNPFVRGRCGLGAGST